MNLADIRRHGAQLRATRQGGVKHQGKLNDCANLALKKLAMDAPQALVPSEEHVILHPQAVSTDATVAAEMAVWSTDDLVLEIRASGGGALSTSTQTWRPAITGAWDGVMHLEVTDANGQIHRRKSLEWWLDVDAQDAGLTRFFVTIDRPWQNTTDASMSFRIHMPHFWLNSDVIHVHDPARLWDDVRQNLWNVHPSNKFTSDMLDFRGESTGPPQRMWRDTSFRPGPPDQNGNGIMVPATAPTVTEANTWVGPEQEGTFTFVYTYVWGYQGFLWSENPAGGYRRPQWESPPSPESTAAVHASSGILTIQCRNPDSQMGFDVAGSKRETHSGYRIRIYVARTAVDTTGNGAYNYVDPDGVYYLLHEFDPNATGQVAAYAWDGSVIPDRRTRLYKSTGYYGYSVWPYQDKLYELDLQVARMPVELAQDQDAIPVQHDCLGVFIELYLYYACLVDGVDTATANQHLSKYEAMIGDLKARYEQPASSISMRPWSGQLPRATVPPRGGWFDG